jgi:hypothetical protein
LSKSASLFYNFFLPAALAFAHLAFIAATILALPAALIFRLAFLTGFVPLTFAQRLFAAAEIFALPAALIFFRFFGAGFKIFSEDPKSLFNSLSSDWIFSFISAANRNCFDDKLVIEFI